MALGDEYRALLFKSDFQILFTAPTEIFENFAIVLWGVGFSFKARDITLDLTTGVFTFVGFAFSAFFPN